MSNVEQEGDWLAETAPPACKLVHYVLKRYDGLTTAELADKTRLPETTARRATKQLQNNGLVTTRRSLQDGRVIIYEVADNE